LAPEDNDEDEELDVLIAAVAALPTCDLLPHPLIDVQIESCIALADQLIAMELRQVIRIE
jgi:hypothetical protein